VGGSVPTGTPLYPGSSTFPGSTTFPGGGALPQLEVLYSTDDASTSTPNWSYAHSGLGGDLREYSVSRGRGTELDTIDASTAQIKLNNRGRAYDPNTNALLDPMNQWWIRVKFGGETLDRFKGYADRYALSWPEKGKDSVTTVYCSDEQKILNLSRLPVMNPPRDTYQDVVMYDVPFEYIRCEMDNTAGLEKAAVGLDVTAVGSSWGFQSPGPIKGAQSEDGSSALDLALGVGTLFYSEPPGTGSEFDLNGRTTFTIEFWFRAEAMPTVNKDLLVQSSVGAGGNPYIKIELETTGAVTATLRTNNGGGAGTAYTATTGVLNTSDYYHLVVVADNTNLRFYVNGAQVASTGYAGQFFALDTTVSALQLGGSTTEAQYHFGHVAFYRDNLSSTRVAAHYTAGTARGFGTQKTDVRVGAVLDSVGNMAPRFSRAGARSVTPQFMTGQPALDEIRPALGAEDVDSMFFAGRDGTLYFLDAGHRVVSPWNTIQLVFDDDGTDLGYWDTDQDLSEAFLFNEWNVTREGGLVQTASDAASIARFRKRTQSITGIPLTSDFDAQAIAQVKVAKYKDPMPRIPSVKPDMSNSDVAIGVLRRELGDKIEIRRNPLGPAGVIVQDAWIQSVSESGKPGEPLDVVLGVSPR